MKHRDVQAMLKSVGVTHFGRIKFASRYLEKVIHADETIEAAAYGRFKEGEGWLALTEAMLVATDRRVIFLNHKPGYTALDEIAYDAVSGCKISHAGLLSAITLYSKAANFTLRFANPDCAQRLADVIEQRRLYAKPSHSDRKKYVASDAVAINFNPVIREFLTAHDTGVLSTLDTGNQTVYGAVMHYLIHENRLYVLTKSDTLKAINMLSSPQVAFTIYDREATQTLQLTGCSFVVTDQNLKDAILALIVQPRKYNNEYQFPPVTKLREGSFMLFGIVPQWLRLLDFRTI